jgi:hypothetical protein
MISEKVEELRQILDEGELERLRVGELDILDLRSVQEASDPFYRRVANLKRPIQSLYAAASHLVEELNTLCSLADSDKGDDEGWIHELGGLNELLSNARKIQKLADEMNQDARHL